MGADKLAMQGARASATLILILLNRDNSVPTRYILGQYKTHLINCLEWNISSCVYHYNLESPIVLDIFTIMAELTEARTTQMNTYDNNQLLFQVIFCQPSLRSRWSICDVLTPTLSFLKPVLE